MQSTLVLKLDSVWFQRHNYKIVFLNPSYNESVLKLKEAIEHGVYVIPDSTRPGFYDVDLMDGWTYIYVREDAQIVYVIAYAFRNSLEAVV